jgi:hypothetical protein
MTRNIVAAWILWALFSSAPALAFTGYAAVDSAEVARSAWREAVRAFSAGDMTTVRAHVERAASAWPEQPAYAQSLARIEAAAGDTLALARSLERLAKLGSGVAVLADSAVRALAAGGRTATAYAALERAVAPHARSTVWAMLSDSTIFPEGADADVATGTVYVGSIRHRTIYAVQGDGKTRDLGIRRWPNVGAIMGVRYDARRKVLWATTTALPTMADYAPADSAIAALLEIDPADGRLIARYDAPPDAPHILGDLAVAPAGDVFVTDSQSPIVFRLAPGGRALQAFQHPLFRSLQGIAPARDGIVYVADYSHGMLRWDTATGVVERMAAPAGTTTLGIDGIVLLDGAIYAVQNGVQPPRVVRLSLDPAGRSIRAVETLDRHLPLADEPTIATVMGDQLIYVADSQWEKYDGSGARRPNTVLAKPVLLALPLRP